MIRGGAGVAVRGGPSKPFSLSVARRGRDAPAPRSARCIHSWAFFVHSISVCMPPTTQLILPRMLKAPLTVLRRLLTFACTSLSELTATEASPLMTIFVSCVLSATNGGGQSKQNVCDCDGKTQDHHPRGRVWIEVEVPIVIHRHASYCTASSFQLSRVNGLALLKFADLHGCIPESVCGIIRSSVGSDGSRGLLREEMRAFALSCSRRMFCLFL